MNRSPAVDYYVVPSNKNDHSAGQTDDNQKLQNTTKKPGHFDQLQQVSQQLSNQRLHSAAQETPINAQTTPFNTKYLTANNQSTASGHKPMDFQSHLQNPSQAQQQLNNGNQRLKHAQSDISKFQVYNTNNSSNGVNNQKRPSNPDIFDHDNINGLTGSPQLDAFQQNQNTKDHVQGDYPQFNPSGAQNINSATDGAFQNYYQAAQLQRTPNAKPQNSGRGSFQNGSGGPGKNQGVHSSGGSRYLSSSSARKSQLHENDLDNLKSTLALVQNRLPENIQTRLSSERKVNELFNKQQSNQEIANGNIRAKKHAPQQEQVKQTQPAVQQNQAPGVIADAPSEQKQIKQSQKELLKQLLNAAGSGSAYKPALGDQTDQRQLAVPGDDRLWRTEPLDRLAARKKAQKVFVPKKQRNSSSKHRPQQAPREDTSPKAATVNQSNQVTPASQENQLPDANNIGHVSSPKLDQKLNLRKKKTETEGSEMEQAIQDNCLDQDIDQDLEREQQQKADVNKNDTEWTPPKNVMNKNQQEAGDDDRSRTQQYKLNRMVMNNAANKSGLISPKANLSQNIGNGNQRRPRVESLGLLQNQDKSANQAHNRDGPASTIEFEAKQNESSFSSDSDFDRNMDEMQSDALADQSNPLNQVKMLDDKMDTKKSKHNFINEVIKEEKYEESNTIGPSRSPLKTKLDETVKKQTQNNPRNHKIEPELNTIKNCADSSSQRDLSRATQSNLNNVKSLEKYIADLQKQKNLFGDSEFDPKKLTEILKKNDELQKKQAEKDQLIEQIQKSLDLRNELLIKYRIESEEYRDQMKQFKALEQQSKEINGDTVQQKGSRDGTDDQHEDCKSNQKSRKKSDQISRRKRDKDVDRVNNRDNSPQKTGTTNKLQAQKSKSKSSRNQYNSQDSHNLNKRDQPLEIKNESLDYFPEQQSDKKKSTVDDFLNRQKRHDANRQRRLEREKKRLFDKEGEELIFRPNAKGKRSASKGSLKPIRSIDDFLKDQERFKNRIQSKIESVKKQQQEDQEIEKSKVRGFSKKSKKILVNASIRKQRKSLQAAQLRVQLTNSKEKKEDGGSSWSGDHNSIDEGLKVNYIGDKKGSTDGENNSSMQANSIEDVDEHPRIQKSSSNKPTFVNKFGFNVDIVHSDNLDTLAAAPAQTDSVVPLLQNKIGGVQISQNPLTSSRIRQNYQINQFNNQQPIFRNQYD